MVSSENVRLSRLVSRRQRKSHSRSVGPGMRRGVRARAWREDLSLCELPWVHLQVQLDLLVQGRRVHWHQKREADAVGSKVEFSLCRLAGGTDDNSARGSVMRSRGAAAAWLERAFCGFDLRGTRR